MTDRLAEIDSAPSARIAESLERKPRRWLLTGSAGFIGSHLLEALLRAGETVVSVDNFATGSRANLDEARAAVGEEAWLRHIFIEGDLVERDICRDACRAADAIVHMAALGSVPRSIADPTASNAANVTAFVNLLAAARETGIKRVVYASSSAVYGDHAGLPKVEDLVGRPLSPYAVSKCANELYAEAFGHCYAMELVGLRYFNVFGPRQDPGGAYAAVIPCWVRAMLRGEPVFMNGDGETTRDFCYVANVVQATLLAATTDAPEALNQVYNVAVGDRTSLNALFQMLRDSLAERFEHARAIEPEHRDFRPGDVRHSQADVSKARRLLGYVPTHDLAAGLREALPWYVEHLAGGPQAPARG